MFAPLTALKQPYTAPWYTAAPWRKVALVQSLHSMPKPEGHQAKRFLFSVSTGSVGYSITVLLCQPAADSALRTAGFHPG